ncbi:MAG: energy transducer TonB [Desulfurivibrionaceae bacterium]|nr:energy transducer TonB [Desulfurivibrionaceae bacterium]
MMTRQIKALLLSCAIHVLLVLAIIGATRTVSVPQRIDLMNFTMLDGNGQEMSAPALPVTSDSPLKKVASAAEASASAPVLQRAAEVGQDTRPVEAAVDANPPIIEQRHQKKAVQAPEREALVAETPPAEPAAAESFVQEERAATKVESATQTVLPKPLASAAGLARPAPSGPANPATLAQTASREAVTGEHSQSSQEQYRTNHFAGIRDRVLRNLRYPAVARKKGWTGQVKLSFRINHEGGVEGITVLASSGYDLLDRQAMAVVRQVAPFPLPLEDAEITMPITFSLTQ